MITLLDVAAIYCCGAWGLLAYRYSCRFHGHVSPPWVDTIGSRLCVASLIFAFASVLLP